MEDEKQQERHQFSSLFDSLELCNTCAQSFYLAVNLAGPNLAFIQYATAGE